MSDDTGRETGWSLSLADSTIKVETPVASSEIPADWGAPAPAPTPVLPTSTPGSLVWYDHPGILLHAGPSPHSGHRHDMFIKCPQAWAYKCVLDCWPKRTTVYATPRIDARTKGSMGHIGLAHFYARAWAEQQGEDPDKYLPWQMAVQHYANKVDTENRNGLASGFVPEAIGTIDAYLNHWVVTRRDVLSVIGVEKVFGFTELVGFPHTRSVDLVVVEADGKIYFWDHKFVWKIQERTIGRYALDGQFLDYCLIGRHLFGDRFGGARLNLISWPFRERVNFHRDMIGAAPWALSQRPELLQTAYAEQQQYAAEGRDPWRYPKRLTESVCQGPYGLCDAFDLCRFGPAQSPGHARLAVVPGKG